MMLQSVKKYQICRWQKWAKTLRVNKVLEAVKLKIFISIELPYWFKTSFWPKILEIYRT